MFRAVLGFARQRLQRGSILVMSTLILAMLAGLSISTLQNVVSEHQVTGQAQDKGLALQAAQYAILEAKRLLANKWASGATQCSEVSCPSAVNSRGEAINQNEIAVWNASAFSGYSDLTNQAANFFDSAQAASSIPGVVAAPRFFSIALGCDPISKTDRYRIVAKGFGASMNTVAYAESTFSIPLSSQNSSSGATLTNITAIAVASDMTAITDMDQKTYTLAKSTSSKELFFKTSGSSCGSSQTGNMAASCEMNCMGEVRVKGYSYYNNNNGSCPWLYGDWVSGTNQSQIKLKKASGTQATVQCGPCQTVDVSTSICPGTGKYNTCTARCQRRVVVVDAGSQCSGGQTVVNGSCQCPGGQTVVNGSCECPGGQILVNGSCACPSNNYWDSSKNHCNQCPIGSKMGPINKSGNTNYCMCKENSSSGSYVVAPDMRNGNQQTCMSCQNACFIAGRYTQDQGTGTYVGQINCNCYSMSAPYGSPVTTYYNVYPTGTNLMKQ